MVEQRSTKAKNLLSGSGCVGCGKVAGVFVASLFCPLSTWARLSLQSCGENVLRITVVDPYIFLHRTWEFFFVLYRFAF